METFQGTQIIVHITKSGGGRGANVYILTQKPSVEFEFADIWG